MVLALGAAVSQLFDFFRNPIIKLVEWIKKQAEEFIDDEPEMWVPFFITSVINVIMLIKDLTQGPF